MLGTLILVLVIVAVGGGLSDRLRLRQEELILSKLAIEAAHAYYQLLVRRVRRFRWLRAACLFSAVIVIYVWRRTRSH